MNQHFDLEALRHILKDDSLHIVLALVTRVVVAPDRSNCRVMVSVLPEKRDLIATMTWEAVGVESGFFVLPNPGDLVLVGQAEGDTEQAFVIRRLTSVDEKIPAEALGGDSVLKSAAGKSIVLSSGKDVTIKAAGGLAVDAAGPAAFTSTGAFSVKGTKFSIGAGTEALLLGTQVKTLLAGILDFMATHTHTVTSLGAPTLPPDQAAQATALKSQNVDNSKILSTVAFTE